MDEWIYFLKNSAIKDEFKAKGLKEASDVLDIMRLGKEEEYGYNRYMDSLSLKESELFSLQTEAEFKIKDEIIIKCIENGSTNEFIFLITGTRIERIEYIRNELKNKS